MMVLMMMVVRSERLPGLVEWEAQQKAVLQAEKELLAGAQPDERTTMETATATTATSATATETGLKSILDLAFQRLLSKLKHSQNHKEDDDDILRTGKKEESGNSNYLDLLLNSYNENDKEIQREVPRSLRKPSISFDEDLFYDNEYYDYHTGDRQRFSKRFRFLYEDESDINLAVKQSRQLDRSLRRFLSKLDKF